MTPPPPAVVAGEAALAAFRAGLTGPFAADLLAAAGGRLLVQLPVGVGKTAWMRATAAHALGPGGHDLVVALFPRRDILAEFVAGLPPGLDPVVLDPRPRRRCGGLDPEWAALEARGCGALGRDRVCGPCPRRRGCPWPGQADRLRAARLVVAAQQHLALDPAFVDRARAATGAARPLVLVDESDLLLRPCDRAVAGDDLRRFAAAQDAALAAAPGAPAGWHAWRAFTRLVLEAAEGDLRAGDWAAPRPDPDWALAVQRHGDRLFGPAFRFVGHDLRHLGRSDRAGRERRPDGGVRFAVPPDLGREFVIFSGSIGPGLARYRLDPNHAARPVHSPFAGTRFEHPGTRWYNLAAADGAARYFPRNAPRVLDLFARLVARNVAAGRRTLLVCRKRFRALCRAGMEDRLRALGVPGARVVTGGWDRHDLADPAVVPLITYGVSGVNRFEGYDAAYCLTGYYVAADAVARAVQDVDAAADRVAVAVEVGGDPPRRRVRVADPAGPAGLLTRAAAEALVQKEADVVVQAVGRVRPFTRPREVITFQQGDLPGVRYAAEFRSAAALRAHFGLPAPAAGRRADRAAAAAALRAAGRTRAEIAAALGVSEATVRRDLRAAGGGPAA